MQMSGIFIIKQEGRIVLPYYYDDIADHPPLALLWTACWRPAGSVPFDGPVGPGVEKSNSDSGRAK
jgi:hypothetical protein